MSRTFVVILALCLGVNGCSEKQLTRSTAQRILRANMASGQIAGVIKVALHVQVGWFEQMWQGNGSGLERSKLIVQPEITFRNHLVDAGVLQKLPDTIGAGGCNPMPACIEHNKWVNFAVIPSQDVEDVDKGLFVHDMNMEYANIVLARPSNIRVTGITQEGIDATVEFNYEYSLTPVFIRIVQQTKDDFAKCTTPELLFSPPSYCPKWGGWLSEADITAKKGTGSISFRNYDDGWRIVK